MLVCVHFHKYPFVFHFFYFRYHLIAFYLFLSLPKWRNTWTWKHLFSKVRLLDFTIIIAFIYTHFLCIVSLCQWFSTRIYLKFQSLVFHGQEPHLKSVIYDFDVSGTNEIALLNMRTNEKKTRRPNKITTSETDTMTKGWNQFTERVAELEVRIKTKSKNMKII